MRSGLIFDVMRPAGARLSVFSWVCFSCLGGAGLLSGQSSLTKQPLETPVAPTSAQQPDEAHPPSAEASPVTAAEQSAVFQAISGEVATIFAKCKGAVVRIEATDCYGRNSGTGFFIDPSGTIYTHYSVAGRSWNLTVEFADKKYPAKCLLADPRSGVTILKIEAGQTPFLPLGRSTDLRIASPVVAIGYPMDLPASPTFGLVAGFDQTFFGRFLATTHIRANVPIQSGEQGAPLLNEHGEVVGIIDCVFDYGAVCHALPVQAAEKVRADYLRFGQAKPGWIGVTVAPMDGDVERGAVKVTQLAEDTPARDCGLREGDVLVRVGRTTIHRVADLRDASFFMTAEEKVPITVMRGDKEITVEARAVNPPGARVVADKDPDNKGVGMGTRLALPNVPRSAP